MFAKNIYFTVKSGVRLVVISGFFKLRGSGMPMKRLGKQLIVELCDCSAEKIDSVDSVEQAMLAAAKAAKATIVAHKFHQFAPQGASGAVIIAESHLAIHTWPEYGYCAIDIFTCGDLDNYLAVEVLKEMFEAKNCVVTEVQRGIPSSVDEDLHHKPALAHQSVSLSEHVERDSVA